MVIFHSYVKLPEGMRLVCWRCLCQPGYRRYDPQMHLIFTEKQLDIFEMWHAITIYIYIMIMFGVAS